MSTKHTPGPLEYNADELAIMAPVVPGDWGHGRFKIVLLKETMFGINPTEDARLLAAAYTSYDKHCGVNAVECAEGDLLGEALEACRRSIQKFEEVLAVQPKRKRRPTLEHILLAKAVLAKARRDHESPST